ncbi:SLOG family protein [Streptomyces cinereoruber]|uniref:SLOG family protein n=1 Tax=Streptomyces cinereoruber TaxID=67260 RepID=UPI0036379B56
MTQPEPYRVLVTGSRDWRAINDVRGALNEILASLPHDQPLIVVHGNCQTGADVMAKVWALTTFTPACTDDWERVTEEPHPAAWNIHGNAAGPIRNKAMVDKGADVCLAFIRNGSRGASHTARLAEQAGIPTRRWTA